MPGNLVALIEHKPDLALPIIMKDKSNQVQLVNPKIDFKKRYHLHMGLQLAAYHDRNFIKMRAID